MSLLRKSVNGKELVIQKRALAPDVFAFYVSFANDPTTFPMVFSKETQTWIFVDKMTFIELKEIEAEISELINNWENE